MRIAEVAEQIGSQEHRAATVSEIAAESRLDESQVIEAMQADSARRTTSLDVPSTRGEDDSAPVVESMGSEEPGFERVESEMASGVAELRTKERLALHHRFHEGLTQREIGELLGVSQMQVSRLLRSALGKLLVAVRGGEEVDAQARLLAAEPRGQEAA